MAATDAATAGLTGEPDPAAGGDVAARPGAGLLTLDAFLHNRPLIMGARDLTPDQIRALCMAHRLAFLTAADAARLGAYAGMNPQAPPALGVPPVCAGAPVTEIAP